MEILPIHKLAGPYLHIIAYLLSVLLSNNTPLANRRVGKAQLSSATSWLLCLNIPVDNTTEADMARRRINHFRNTCGRAIPQAIIGCTQVGPPFERFAWNVDLWLSWIIALLDSCPTRIDRYAARFRSFVRMPVPVPIGRPF